MKVTCAYSSYDYVLITRWKRERWKSSISDEKFT